MDDTTVIVSDKDEMTELINLVKIVSEKLRLLCVMEDESSCDLVVDWTKCLLISKIFSKYKKFSSFVYLESTVEEDDGPMQE